MGEIDGVAKFAGTGGHRLGLEYVWKTTSEEFYFIMDLDIRGLHNIMAAAFEPGVLEELSSFVHISSMYAGRDHRMGLMLTASKFAANGMVKATALELGARYMGVDVVMP